MSAPIRLFVGADSNHGDLESQAVLEYSVRQHASRPVAITWMQHGVGPWAGWASAAGRTPFTHFRWSIPSVCEYAGRAVYCDSDFIFRADIAELWDEPIPDGAVLLARQPGGKVRTCCLLIDCGRARGHVPDLAALRAMSDPQASMVARLKAHRALMAPFTTGDWNCIDLKGYDAIDDPRIKAIHYSRMETQLHLKYARPRLQAEGRRHWYEGPVGPHWRPELQALFDDLLEQAIAAGYSPDRYRLTDARPAPRRAFVYAHSRVTS